MPTTAVSSRWVEKRTPYWNRLGTLVEKGRGGVSAFTHDELRELALLYRQTAADLAAAREHRADAHLAAYLNQLLGRAHNLVYSASPGRSRNVFAFYARTFPQVFRDTWPYTLAATVIFLMGGLLGVAVSVSDPGFERHLLGGAMMDTIERREMWTHSILAVKPLASSRILTNNLSVSFAAFALGITAGAGTVWLMLLNGVLIGVIATACFRAGMSVPLWSFVAPHGALELPAIFIAGGAGLLLGRALVAPGTLPRGDALRLHGGTAVRLLLGVVPLLILAGIAEGFVSPTGIDPLTKVLTGASLFVLLLLYLFRAGQTSAVRRRMDGEAYTSPLSRASR